MCCGWRDGWLDRLMDVVGGIKGLRGGLCVCVIVGFGWIVFVSWYVLF